MGEWRGSAAMESCRDFYRSGVLKSGHNITKVIFHLSCFRSYKNFAGSAALSQSNSISS